MPRVRFRPRAHAPPAPALQPYGPQPGIATPRRTQQATQHRAPTSEALTLSSVSFVALPKPELRRKHEAASVKGENGSREGSPAEETARGSRAWEARARAAGLGAQYEFFRAPSFLSFRPPPRAPPWFSPGRTAQQGYKAQS